MFIPIAGWVGKIAKVDKLIPDELLTLLKTQGTNLAKQLNTKNRNSKLKVLQQCAELLEIFAKGEQAIKYFFTKLGDDIGKWFVENKKFVEGWANKIKEAFSKEGKTEEFFRKIEKKLNLAGEEILTSNDIKKLRRLLKETFEVHLEFVDQNPKLRAKLKDWKRRRVAGSFNMVEGVMYLRKSVTAYTVQHEMFHMKLWYKMTKEFPELQPLFQKTLGIKNRLFHEEYILAEFMKNPNKWNEVDLLNDLKFVNELREKKRLPNVDLEYFKNWNLEEELLKFK